jgi:hypothetical protein
MSIKDWLAVSADLTRELEVLARSGDGAEKIKTRFPYVIARLEKLAAYFNAQADNAKGYFKDPVQRDAAIAALALRERAAIAMVTALKELSN